MPVISSTDAATHAAIDLIRALKNLVLAALLSPLGTEKLYALRKFVERFQGQIISKTKLETTETQTKIVK